jgi:hypothetical protein
MFKHRGRRQRNWERHLIRKHKRCKGKAIREIRKEERRKQRETGRKIIETIYSSMPYLNYTLH